MNPSLSPSFDTPQPADSPAGAAGICLTSASSALASTERAQFEADLSALALSSHVEWLPAQTQADGRVRQTLRLAATSPAWSADFDTIALCERAQLAPAGSEDDLLREIWLALLMSPLAFDYPSRAELLAAVRIRRNIVVAARRTALAFDTAQAERPEDCWTYVEDKGFVIQPGAGLITALVKATQPEVSGRLYSFSCYRATEYVLLLAIAQELEPSNPALLAQLQQQWAHRPIMSGQFHDVFLREYGSMEAPLPPTWYVPGDRVWFRNPDAHSSDASGYEGSWVFYLGGGLFTNFWVRDQPFTLAAKCIEIFHWRDATFIDAAGELRIDETLVAARVARTLADPSAAQSIVSRMQRLRDGKGVYGEGGCIDTSREVPLRVCAGTAEIVLPGF